MDVCGDFIQYLNKDTSMKILMSLDDPFDLARVSAVSTSWRQFVIDNGLCKQLCQRICPQLSNVVDIVEFSSKRGTAGSSPSNPRIPRELEMDHKAYSFLACGLMSSVTEDCIEVAMSASSTDNYPEESIENTLEASNRIEQRASYWSSKGERDPAVPETLVYKLSANFCVISEIHIQPFQVLSAYFQFGFPIYSAKAVRFHMGHLKSPFEMEKDLLESASTQRFSDEMFVWTYTSPEFPMAQVNDAQQFRLPKPVLCIGGILKIELLGRVQRQEMDGLYYICLSYVQAVGRRLSPVLDVDILDQTGRCSLKYHPEADYYASTENRERGSSTLQSISSTLVQRSVRSWEHIILSALLANGVLPDYEDLDDDNLIA